MDKLVCIEIIKLMRAEGHCFIWYYILKPLPIYNPDSFILIKLLSAFFAVISIGIIWFKSPFNNLEKFLITFSYPMLLSYPVLARPYSMGIMLLFILAALFQKRLEHPVLFSTLIMIE